MVIYPLSSTPVSMYQQQQQQQQMTQVQTSSGNTNDPFLYQQPKTVSLNSPAKDYGYGYSRLMQLNAPTANPPSSLQPLNYTTNSAYSYVSNLSMGSTRAAMAQSPGINSNFKSMAIYPSNPVTLNSVISVDSPSSIDQKPYIKTEDNTQLSFTFPANTNAQSTSVEYSSSSSSVNASYNSAYPLNTEQYYHTEPNTNASDQFSSLYVSSSNNSPFPGPLSSTNVVSLQQPAFTKQVSEPILRSNTSYNFNSADLNSRRYLSSQPLPQTPTTPPPQRQQLQKTKSNNGPSNRARMPGRHKCDKCDKVFTRNWNLKLHYEINHLKVPPRHCSICSKAFNRKSDMNRHIKEIHLGRQRYQLNNTSKRHLKGTLDSSTSLSSIKQEGSKDEVMYTEDDIRLLLTKSSKRHSYKHSNRSSTAVTATETGTGGLPMTVPLSSTNEELVNPKLPLFICSGLNPDGTKWGCGARFVRKYQYKNHLKTKKASRYCKVPVGFLDTV